MELNISKQETLFIKGMAILFVILSHMGLFDCGGVIGVHLFLIISGYGIYCSYEKHGKLSYWKRRVSSVYIPYLFSMFILFILRLIIYNNNISWKNILVTILGLDFNLNIDPTMWYISYIFSCYFIAWGVFQIQSYKKKTWLAPIFGVSCFVIITACGYKHVIWHQGTNVWAYGLSFPLGMLMARFRIEKRKVFLILKKILVILSGGGVIFLLKAQHESWIKFLFTLSTAVIILTICGCLFKYKKDSIIIQPILNIGRYSYFMYLNEAFVIGCIQKAIPAEQMQNYSMQIMTTVLVIITSYILAVVFNKLYKNALDMVTKMA